MMRALVVFCLSGLFLSVGNARGAGTPQVGSRGSWTYDFEDTTGFHNTWVVGEGTVEVQEGGFAGVGEYWAHGHATGSTCGRMVQQDPSALLWRDYCYSFDVRFSSNDSWCYALAYFYLQSASDFPGGSPRTGYVLWLKAYYDQVVIFRHVDGVATALAAADFTIDRDVDYHVTVCCSNGTFTVTINTNQVLLVNDTAIPSGTIGVGATTGGGSYSYIDAYWDNFTVTCPDSPPPELLAPSNGALCQGVSGTLSWSDVPGATGYAYQLGTACEQGPETGVESPEASYSGLQPGMTYHWRVKARDTMGQWGSYSTCFSFTTRPSVPSPPGLLTPPNEAPCQVASGTLDWSDVSGATGYMYQLGTVCGQGSETPAENSEASYSGLQTETTYYWRVKARDGCDQWGSYSACFSFTTAPSLPSPPALLTPPNGVSCRAATGTLDWSDAPGATRYRIQYGTVCGQGAEMEVTTSGIPYHELQPETTYHWRVKARDGCDQWGSYSACFSFTTAPSLPSPPALLAPPNEAPCRPATGTLDWSDVSGATGYAYQLGTDCGQGSETLSGSSEASYSGLQPGATYYWRVKAKDVCGQWGSYSTCSSFAVLPIPLAAPTLQTPADGAKCQSDSVTVDWSDVSGATGYMYQLGPVCGQGLENVVPGPEASYFGLQPGTTYYWRVKTRDDCDQWGSYSNCFSFTTAPSSPPSAPTLLAPSNAALLQPVSGELDWTDAQGATGYAYQLGTDCEQGPETQVERSEATYSELQPETTYYWRVRTRGECDLWGSYSNCFSFTTAPSSLPSPPTLLAPSNEASCQPLTGTLYWSDMPGAAGYTYQLESGCAQGTETVVDSSEASYVGLQPGTTYYWRVKTNYEYGQSGGYSACFSFTTAPSSLPSPPMLLIPSDEASCQTASGVLNWSEVPGATGYTYQIGTDCEQGTETVVDSSDASYSGLQAGTTYYWRVKTRDECNQWGGYSTCFSFTTAPSSPPNPPTLLAPSNEASCQAASGTLDWSDVPGATGYTYQLGTDCEQGTETEVGSSEAAYSGLQPGTDYYWRVKTRDECGQWGSYSACSSFTTAPGNLPSQPALLTPSNERSCQAASGTLDWWEVPGATGYTYQLGTGCEQGTETEVGSSEAAYSGLQPGTDYYWRVKTRDDCNQWGSYSDCFWFTTAPSLPYPPPLLTPTNGDSCQPTAGTLLWEIVPGATGYTYQLGTDCEQGAETPAGSPEASYSELQPGATYHWRVKTRDECGQWGNYSACFSFTTASSLPDLPAPVAPSDGALCQGVSGTLRWSDVPGAAGYMYQLGTDCEQGTETPVGSCEASYSGLQPGTTYHWRVKARDGCGQWGNYSICYRFTTMLDPLSSPALLSPQDGETDQTLSGILDWSDVPGATSYVYKLATDCGLGEERSVTSSRAEYSGLRPGTTYYWLVKAQNACGSGTYSSCFSFTSQPGDGSRWGELPSGDDLIPRGRQSVVHDPLRDRLILFGGCSANGSCLNEVWALPLVQGGKWALLETAGTPPPGRHSHSAIYDPVRDRMVIFAGAVGPGASAEVVNEVWTLDLGSERSTWIQLTPSGTAPEERHSHTAICDPIRDRMIVFGGWGADTHLNDTWALSLGDNPTWMQLLPSGSPPSARNGQSAVYDPLRDRMLVFGGGGRFDAMNDLWSLSLGEFPTWGEITLAEALPPQRQDHIAVYDPGTDEMLVFGGRADDPRNDSWSLSLRGVPAWRSLAPTETPPLARYSHSAVYDQARDRLLVVGGALEDSSLYNDTWELQRSPIQHQYRLFLGPGGILNGQEVENDHNTVIVVAGDTLAGDLLIRHENDNSGNAVVPVEYAPSWGDHATSWREAAADVPYGVHSLNVPLSLTAPNEAGTYYILFAALGQLRGGFISSMTSHTTHEPEWDDGNDLADLREYDLLPALRNGWCWLRGWEGDHFDYWPTGATFLKVVVPPLSLTWSADMPDTSQIQQAGDAVPISVRASCDAPIDSLVLHYAPGSAPEYHTQHMSILAARSDTVTFVGSIPGTVVGPSGARFYVTGHAGTLVTYLRRPGDPECIRVGFSDFVFPKQTVSSVYGMISVPFRFATSSGMDFLLANLGERDPRQWRLFEYDRQGQGYAEVVDDIADLSPGSAYWLITRRQVLLDTGAATCVSTRCDRSDSMELSPGWNMIGDPFMFPVPWDSVLVGTGTGEGFLRDAGRDSVIDPPYWWDPQRQGYQDSVEVLQPFEGYWVRNKTTQPVTLLVPPSPVAAERSVVLGKGRGEKLQVGPVGGEGWSMRVRAATAALEDACNYVGVRAGASSEADRWDRMEPPVPPGVAMSLYFPHPGWSSGAGNYSSDIRDAPTPETLPSAEGLGSGLGHCWHFDVARESLPPGTGEWVTLTFSSTENVPAANTVSLFDRELSLQVDLCQVPEYRFLLTPRGAAASEDRCRFVLVVGNGLFVEDREKDWVYLPRQTALRDVRPSPSPEGVRLRYDLSSASRVALDVHDVLGAHVRSLDSGARGAGRYEAFWDGRDELNRQVSSGVYFVRLKAGSVRVVRKILIAR